MNIRNFIVMKLVESNGVGKLNNITNKDYVPSWISDLRSDLDVYYRINYSVQK